MRYIHDGKLRNAIVDPPVRFVFAEPTTHGTGRTDMAALAAKLAQSRRRGGTLARHDSDSEWRWV